MAAGWSTAVTQTRAAFRTSYDRRNTETTFLDLMDKAAAGVDEALAGSAHVDPEP